MATRTIARSLVLPALALLAAAASVGAQGAPPPPDSITRLRTVQVTETRSVAATGGAAAVIVNTLELKASPAPLLDQALRESPFLQVRRNSRGEMELSVRGSDSRQAAVMIDGVPLTLGWDHRTDPSLIPITGSEEIVITPGLGSLLNGPNSLGGTVSISQRDVAPQPGPARAWGGIGVDQTGAIVTTFGAGRTMAAGTDRVTVRGGVSYRERDGVTLPGGVTDPTSQSGRRTNTDLKEIDGFASLRWNGRAGRTLGLSITGFDAERGVPPEEHLAEPRLWRYPYSSRAVVALSAGSGLFETPWGHGTLKLSTGYNSGRTKIEAYTDRTYATVDDEELGDERTATARAHLTHTLPKSASLAAAFTIADVRYDETLSPDPAVSYRQVLWSGGAEVEAPVGSRTTFAAGIVADNASTPESGGRPKQDALNSIGWRSGITHQASDAWRLNASVSRRSRFPALRELYSGALNRFVPNPELKPETLVGVEGGFAFQAAIGGIPDATIQVTGFRHRLDDAVVRTTLQNPTRFKRVNRDRIESTGIEAIGGLSFGGARAMTLTADATIQRIRIIDQTAGDAARHSENNPEVRGSLGVGMPLAWQLRGSASARYIGTQYCINGDTGSEMRLDGKALGDVSVERGFSFVRGLFQSVRALIAIDNVGDVAVYDQCGLPQPGRTLRLMVNFR